MEYYDIQSLLGVQFTQEFSSGVSILYRFRKDTCMSQKLTTEDYGGTLFARYSLLPAIFLQCEYEYLNYKYYCADLINDRDGFTSFSAGAWMAQSLGGNGTLHGALFYNLSYDQSNSPYGTPWFTVWASVSS